MRDRLLERHGRGRFEKVYDVEDLVSKIYQKSITDMVSFCDSISISFLRP